MKKLFAMALFLAVYAVFAFAEDEESFRSYISGIMDTCIIEVEPGKVSVFKSERIREGMLSELQKGTVFFNQTLDDKIEAYTRLIETGNYELRNVIKFDGGKYFLNYQVRTNDAAAADLPGVSDVLGPLKYNYYITCIYDDRTGEANQVKLFETCYSDLNFQVYRNNGDVVLYFIQNNSSLGGGSSELYLVVLDPFTLKCVASEQILSIRRYFFEGVSDVEVFRRFAFIGSELRITGNEYDRSTGNYTSYSKLYSIPSLRSGDVR